MFVGLLELGLFCCSDGFVVVFFQLQHPFHPDLWSQLLVIAEQMILRRITNRDQCVIKGLVGSREELDATDELLLEEILGAFLKRVLSEELYPNIIFDLDYILYMSVGDDVEIRFYGVFFVRYRRYGAANTVVVNAEVEYDEEHSDFEL